jgi:site-specific recombinase XerD
MARGRPPSNRPLSPRTEAVYRQILMQAFGRATPPFPEPVTPIAHFSPIRSTQLQAAIRWACRRTSYKEEQFAHLLPEPEWRPTTEVEIPAEEEMQRYEAAALQILPPGRRALALLPLKLGLRSAEVLELRREAVQRAHDFGELKLVRKGGKERVLPARNAKDLFAELLNTPKASPLHSIEQQMREFRAHVNSGERWGAQTEAGKWKLAGQILSTGGLPTQYQRLYALVHKVGDAARVDGLRPHKLRHAFATRMIKKGASLPLVQWMLGHASPSTTGRYLHVTAADVERYI